jgi:hypothetical protein
MAGLRAADLRWSRAEGVAHGGIARGKLCANHLVVPGRNVCRRRRLLARHGRRIGGPAASDRDWAPSLASAKAGLTSIGAISVVDRTGIIRHSTRVDIIGQSRSDQYIVRDSIAAAADDLIVGIPFPTVVEPRQLLIPIGRRLTREDGTQTAPWPPRFCLVRRAVFSVRSISAREARSGCFTPAESSCFESRRHRTQSANRQTTTRSSLPRYAAKAMASCASL